MIQSIKQLQERNRNTCACGISSGRVSGMGRLGVVLNGRIGFLEDGKSKLIKSFFSSVCVFTEDFSCDTGSP